MTTHWLTVVTVKHEIQGKFDSNTTERSNIFTADDDVVSLINDELLWKSTPTQSVSFYGSSGNRVEHMYIALRRNCGYIFIIIVILLNEKLFILCDH